MQPEIIFRPAQPPDWERVSALLTSARLPLEGAQAHLSDFVLAFREGDLIGSAGLERYGEYALLRSVAVAESERGKGLGFMLVKRMLAQAKQLGIVSLVLLTETAKDFFLRLGFREIARAAAPEPVSVSVEFQHACPVSATVMQLDFCRRYPLAQKTL